MSFVPTAQLTSKTLPEARRRVLHLYREVQKAVPEVMRQHNFYELSVNEVRKRVAAEFRKHSDVKDPQVIDMLAFRGEQELQETVEQWKTFSHLYKYFAPKPKESDFLTRFYEGR